jgi:hypothetical protein
MHIDVKIRPSGNSEENRMPLVSRELILSSTQQTGDAALISRHRRHRHV